MQTVLFYSPRSTTRLRYIVRFVLEDIGGFNVDFTTEIDRFQGYRGAKLAYSPKPVEGGLYIAALNFLYEKGLKEFEPDVFPWEHTVGLFKTGFGGALPFDVFSASFYLVSRYEEYLPHTTDKHGRFDASSSFAFRNGFLAQPVVDIWALRLRDLICEKFPHVEPTARHYRFEPTIDVDNAYAFLEKGWLRTTGAFARSAIQFNFKDIIKRSQVLAGVAHDPYDTFDYLIALQKEKHLEPIYFLLVADYGQNDKNVPISSIRFKSLIKTIADYAEVGIHPSYTAVNDVTKLKTEIRRLQGTTFKEITKSRQHFLRLVFPQTYRNLLETEITDDYTMGYPTEPGFRAGTCTPFVFYDLDHEHETVLQIHPFCVMEATFAYYKHIDPKDVMMYIKPLVEEVKKVQGTFSFLWHNDFLSDTGEFKGWRDVFAELVEIGNPK